MNRDELPILAHKVAPGQFDLAASLSYISLKDQAVRVRNLLLSLQREAGLGPSSRVLVVGAGFAGVNAALWLAHRGIHVLLIDSLPQPFSAQRGCTTRHVSITQYEWPSPTYSLHAYPTPHAGYPWTLLPAPVDYLDTSQCLPVNDHVQRWTTQFAAACTTMQPFLSWKPSCELRGRPRTVPTRGQQDRLTEAVLYDGPTRHQHTETFHFILFAVGFGSDGDWVPMLPPPAKPPAPRRFIRVEDTSVATPRFWEDDGLASRAHTESVLISGGGDGALQDFIRAVVLPHLPTASHVLDAVNAALQQAAGPAQASMVAAAWATLQANLAAAELQAGRAAAWTGEQHDVIWAALARSYERECTDFERSLLTLLDPALQSVLRPVAQLSVALIHENAQPRKTYGLNRFFLTLFTRYLNRVQGAPPPVLGPGMPFGVRVLPNSRLLCDSSAVATNTTHYDPGTGLFHVLWEDQGTAARHSAVVDTLLIRHGTKKPSMPWINVTKGRSVRGGLGRFALPLSAAE